MIRAFIAFIILLVTATACISRKEIEAVIWLNNSPLPAELCTREPILSQYGFYRRLNNGKFEFISFCNPEATKWFAIHEKDMANILDQTLPSKEKKKLENNLQAMALDAIEVK